MSIIKIKIEFRIEEAPEFAQTELIISESAMPSEQDVQDDMTQEEEIIAENIVEIASF